MNAQIENNTKTLELCDLDKSIDAAINSFEAFLYDIDRQQSSDKLLLVNKCLSEIREALVLDKKNNLAAYSESLSQLVMALSESVVENESNAHDVILGGLNQFSNHLNLENNSCDNISPLYGVQDDIRAISGEQAPLPSKLVALTQGLDKQLPEDLLRTQKGCYDWIDIAVWQQEGFFTENLSIEYKNQSKERQEYLNNKKVLEQLSKANIEDLSFLDQYLLAIAVLLNDIVSEKTISPSVMLCLRNALQLLSTAPVAIQTQEKEPLAKTMIEQFRKLLLVLNNQGCVSIYAQILIEKYTLKAIYRNDKNIRLRLSSPDQKTQSAFISNVSEDVKTINTALQAFSQQTPSRSSIEKLRAFAVNLMQATKLAGYENLAAHFSQLDRRMADLTETNILDSGYIEALAAEMILIKQELAKYQRDGEKNSTHETLVKLLVICINEFRLALETENITVNDQSDDQLVVSQALLESAVSRFVEAMPAIQFLNDEPATLMVSDTIRFAEQYLLPLNSCLAPEVGQSVLQRFSRALHLVEKYFNARYFEHAEQISEADSLLLQTRQYLAELYDKHHSMVANVQQETAGFVAVNETKNIVVENTQEIPNENKHPNEIINDVANEEVASDCGDGLDEASENDGAQPSLIEEELDDEIVEIFLEEADEVCQTIREQYAIVENEDWQNNTAEIIEPVQELRRAYHTLKGSGRMAGASHVGEAAWLVEDLLNRIMDNTVVLNPSRMSLLSDAGLALEGMVAAFSRRELPATDEYEKFIKRATYLLANESEIECEQKSIEEHSADNFTVNLQQIESLENELVCSENPHDISNDFSDDDLPVDDESEKDNPLESFDALGSLANVEDDSIIEQNTEQVESQDVSEQHEADDVLQSIFRDEAEAQLLVLSSYLKSNTASQAKQPNESLERALHTLVGGANVTKAMSVVKVALPAEILVGRMRLRGEVTSEQYQLLQQVETWLSDYFQGKEEGVEQTESLVDALNVSVEFCFEEPADISSLEAALHSCKILYQAEKILNSWRTSITPPDDLHILTKELEAVSQTAHEFSVVTDLSNALLNTYKSFKQGGLHFVAYSVAKYAHVELERMLDNVATGIQPEISTSIDLLQGIVKENEALEQLLEEMDAELTQVSDTITTDKADDEILLIFLEESHELLEELEVNVHRWLAKQTDSAILDEILRLLHTIKGGARMAGLNSVGDLCHEFEELLQKLSSSDETAGQNIAKRVTDQLNALVALLSDAKSDKNSTNTSDNNDERPAEEFVRVQASSMEQLVNLAGETSISRSLIEQRMSDFGYAIEEIDSTVERLNEQLRRLEIETEAQIHFRKEQVEIERLEEFDPLEMDRYSHLQQLSRSLIESASDLQALKSTLVDKTRDVETLLIQQARINTELQEGLMRTRTVPLSRTIIPRLRRTIRQVSGELDKPVKLEIANNEGELDRSVIERMAVPLEHVMRNAIDHGIESAAERIKQGKPELGTITLDLKREGSEVVISLTDDGSGIDIDAVRKKAISLKLMGENEQCSNEEIMHFIFSRGFSTMSAVTQISGRGIGMDVVQTEIRELGGSISLYSEPGKGTTFIFRLPFTVSMNRALLVTAGGETLAVPIDAVEGVVRVSPYELDEYYGEQAVDFMYAGEKYDFSYLGTYLNGSSPSYQPDMIGALPVLLVRAGESLVALQVDRLLGSREIVVKSLGAQFTGLKTASGATILGDGSVVMIADLSALVRNQVKDNKSVSVFNHRNLVERPSVMVVDDSVTVRKVTSRLLDRNGFDVLTAKDGLHAMEMLDEKLPDVILLDIEMPNLDGFEVVSRVRHDPRIKHIPIIMISSRTGAKHRDRALTLGANEFLGKPFQEDELLEMLEIYTTQAVVESALKNI